MEEVSNAVLGWWAFMSLLGLFNIGLWWMLGRRIKALAPEERPEIADYRRWQWIMAGIYAFGCASRGMILRGDVQRHSMIDLWISNVMVGRSVATIAEICFVVQWALMLGLLAKLYDVKAATVLAWVLVPLIVFAECASWFAVITTNYIGNAIEESTWALTATLFMVGLLLCYRPASAHVRKCIHFCLVFGVMYVAYMVTTDVPNYITSWQESEAAGRAYLTFAEGFQDIQRYEVTLRYEDWSWEMVWMTPYFSVAVWMSLTMMLWPRFPKASAPDA